MEGDASTKVHSKLAVHQARWGLKKAESPPPQRRLLVDLAMCTALSVQRFYKQRGRGLAPSQRLSALTSPHRELHLPFWRTVTAGSPASSTVTT